MAVLRSFTSRRGKFSANTESVKEVKVNELSVISHVRTLDIDPKKVRRIELIHQEHGDHVYRIRCNAKSSILKVFKDATEAAEIQSYELLQRLKVPTLAVRGQTQKALLLEDLATSPSWRLAKEDDLTRAEIGKATAKWYQALHSTGRGLLSGEKSVPSFVRREVDELDPYTIEEIGKKLGLAHNSVWKLAADNIERIKKAMRSLPETLNYNDFHWTNLALSRSEEEDLQAVVYDYHLLGIGLAYSDCRNVTGSLKDKARSSFWETYGPIDEREKLLDDPTAVLYALFAALRLPTFPHWGQGCLDKVENGGLEKSLRRALEIV